jgi:hypothetical protein
MPRDCRWGGQRGDPTDVGDDLIFIRVALLLGGRLLLLWLLCHLLYLGHSAVLVSVANGSLLLCQPRMSTESLAPESTEAALLLPTRQCHSVLYQPITSSYGRPPCPPSRMTQVSSWASQPCPHWGTGLSPNQTKSSISMGPRVTVDRNVPQLCSQGPHGGPLLNSSVRRSWNLLEVLPNVPQGAGRKECRDSSCKVRSQPQPFLKGHGFDKPLSRATLATAHCTQAQGQACYKLSAQFTEGHEAWRDCLPRGLRTRPAPPTPQLRCKGHHAFCKAYLPVLRHSSSCPEHLPGAMPSTFLGSQAPSPQSRLTSSSHPRWASAGLRIARQCRSGTGTAPLRLLQGVHESEWVRDTRHSVEQLQWGQESGTARGGVTTLR